MISKLHISHQLKKQIQYNTRKIQRQEPKASESSKNDTVPTASTDTCIESSGLGMAGRNSRSSRCWFRAKDLGAWLRPQGQNHCVWAWGFIIYGVCLRLYDPGSGA